MSHLHIHSLNKQFGQFTALADIELTVAKGEFVVLLGPSGCGKTTLLRTIAGLEQQDSGTISHAGRDISALPPGQRDYGIVFQSYALFPNLNVGQNVAYGLNSRKAGRDAFRQRVDEMLALVGLPGTENKFPSQLSGGQQQRIALARALATRPDLLLLDEPLSALDAIERVRLRSEIRQLQQALGVTTIMVTHDQEEALAMADRVVVMRSGRIQQIGTPHAIYRAPGNDFVADFIGRSNLITARAIAPHQADYGGLMLHSAQALETGKSYRFNVRPEDVQLLDGAEAQDNSLYARIIKSEFLGAYTLVTLAPAHHSLPPLQAQFSSNYLAGRSLAVDSHVRIAIPAASLCLMPDAA
ncbi:putative 2-aminoethylphosphonate ABC transporter ATP-binding protein [Rhodoferax sp. OV413]|uniref:putative 2-aminoethylphosphonate ABC transporter ATP-binding protein n=1 Tax=Rhodoferax sp. OV413 TaxID=1855285 RepID=UPI0025D118A7|nr:putative 2-aminoethylphosphonate ABC transporter ATP-binding protein [Rhodoferax sp. OV413]